MIKTLIEGNKCYHLELKNGLTIDEMTNLIVKALQENIIKKYSDSMVLVTDSSCYPYGADKGIMVVPKGYDPSTHSSLSAWYSDAIIAYDVRANNRYPKTSYQILACKELPDVKLTKLLTDFW
jgi:hypothetical protein